MFHRNKVKPTDCNCATPESLVGSGYDVIVLFPPHQSGSDAKLVQSLSTEGWLELEYKWSPLLDSEGDELSGRILMILKGNRDDA